MAFGRLVQALVSGCGYERAADEHCLATRLRCRRGQVDPGPRVVKNLLLVLSAYGPMTGLDPDHLVEDGCVTKALSSVNVLKIACGGAPRTVPAGPEAAWQIRGLYRWKPCAL